MMIELIFIWSMICAGFFLIMALASWFADNIMSQYWPVDPAWPNRPGDDDEYDVRKDNG